jgi:hypothetical protein
MVADSPLEQGGFELSVPPAGAGLFATSGMEKPEFANDVAGFECRDDDARPNRGVPSRQVLQILDLNAVSWLRVNRAVLR